MVEAVRLLRQRPAWIRPTRARNNRRVGQIYERKAQKYLSERYPGAYVPSPWFAFSDGGTQRYCCPDGLLFDLAGLTVTIVEIKLKHNSDAWWQLQSLYRPVVAERFPGLEVRLAEVVRWYDPQEPFPGPHKLISCLSLCPLQPTIGVHIYGRSG